MTIECGLSALEPLLLPIAHTDKQTTHLHSKIALPVIFIDTEHPRSRGENVIGDNDADLDRIVIMKQHK